METKRTMEKDNTDIMVNMLVFILLLHQGAAGAAWATIIGNFFAVLYYIAIFLKGKTSLSIAPHGFQPSARIFQEVLKIGLPNSVSQIIMSFSNILLNNLAVGAGRVTPRTDGRRPVYHDTWRADWDPPAAQAKKKAEAGNYKYSFKIISSSFIFPFSLKPNWW